MELYDKFSRYIFQIYYMIPSLDQEVEIRTLQHVKESSNRNQYQNSVEECVKRIQYVSKGSSFQLEEGLIVNYSFQDKKEQGL